MEEEDRNRFNDRKFRSYLLNECVRKRKRCVMNLNTTIIFFENQKIYKLYKLSLFKTKRVNKNTNSNIAHAEFHIKTMIIIIKRN